MVNPDMTAEEFFNTLSAFDLKIKNIIPTILKAYNQGYSNGFAYAFKTCGVNLENI